MGVSSNILIMERVKLALVFDLYSNCSCTLSVTQCLDLSKDCKVLYFCKLKLTLMLLVRMHRFESQLLRVTYGYLYGE